MRKGAKKRSASQRAAASQPDQLTEDAPAVAAQVTGGDGGHPGGPQPKRARASRKDTASAEPEFFEDKRNLFIMARNRGSLEDLYVILSGYDNTEAKHVGVSKSRLFVVVLDEKKGVQGRFWMAAFPVGTEWDQLDNVYQMKWNFSNLEEAFEEGGKLCGKRVYVFGCTEPQLVSYRGESRIIYVPAVVAVVSPFPPSDKIGIKSVQRESEEIVPMKQMKLDWVPYVPFEDRGRRVDRLKSEIFIMSCTQRRAALKHLKIDRLKKYEYCLPYFNDPLKEDEDEQSTVVPILFPSEPKPVFCEYDWEFDEYEDFIENLIKEEELSEDQREAFKAYLKEKVREAKKANREAREARKKAVEEMSEETRSAFENMKVYKFYPVQTTDSPDISNCKVPFVNRYYRKAHEVL